MFKFLIFLIKLSRTNRQGAVLATTAISALFLTTVTFLSINAASLHHVSVELQNAADASALAGVTLIPIDATQARQAIHDVSEGHLAGGEPVILRDEDIIFGQYNLTAKVFQANITPYNAVRVIARRDANSQAGAVPIFLGSLLGVPTANLTRTALAIQDNRINNAKLIPYAAYRPVVDPENDGFNIGEKVNLYASSETPPGNFAWIDFDGQQNSNPDLRDWLLNGFNGLEIPAWVPGNPGTQGQSVYPEFANLIGKIVIMPIYDNYQLQGDNGEYYMEKFVAVKILSVKLNGAPISRKVMAEIVSTASSGFGIDPGQVSNNSLYKIRLAE